MTQYNLHFRWTTSRGRDTYGYNICTLFVGTHMGTDVKVAACNGGGYDMQGTCLGNWIAEAFVDKLIDVRSPFHGLTWHDPNFDPGKAVPEIPTWPADADDKGKTVERLEEEGKSLGLDRYQQFYKASNPTCTARHLVPLIDGAVGFDSVAKILRAIGGELTRHKQSDRSQNHAYYEVTFAD